MLLLHNKDGYEAIREKLDVCLCLEVDMELCHKRLVDRKVLAGRDREDSERHYRRVDSPNHERVEATKHRADLVLVMDSSACIATARLNKPSS